MKLAAGAIAVFLAFPVQAQEDKSLQNALRKVEDGFNRRCAGDDEKIDAIKALAQFKAERVVKTLTPSLTHGSIKVRMAVARELGNFANVNGTPEALIATLKTYETGAKN